MVINSDKKFVEVVKIIAKNRPADPIYVEKAAKYLWSPKNWNRLSETLHGRFMRELDNRCPDYSLRYQYRTDILKE